VKTLLAFMRRADEGTLCRVMVETTIVLAASRHNGTTVLKDAARCLHQSRRSSRRELVACLRIWLAGQSQIVTQDEIGAGTSFVTPSFPFLSLSPLLPAALNSDKCVLPGRIVVFKTTFEVFTSVSPHNSFECLTERSVGLVTDQPSDVYELLVTLL
jgi:hypothetical protein